VYQARVKDTGETVAIKVIPVGEHDDAGDIQKEIDMLRDCDHPNVVRYLARMLPLLTRTHVPLVRQCSSSPSHHPHHSLACCATPLSQRLKPAVWHACSSVGARRWHLSQPTQSGWKPLHMSMQAL
jgi:hypothetical protein